MKSFSKTFFFTAMVLTIIKITRGTRYNINISWPLSFSGKVLFQCMYSKFIIYLDCPLHAPTNVEVLWVMNNAVLFNGNSIFYFIFIKLDCLKKIPPKKGKATQNLAALWDRRPIKLGWLKQELNLMPHFLPEMRQALWLDLAKMDLFLPMVART